jgi:hypothetical protein
MTHNGAHFLAATGQAHLCPAGSGLQIVLQSDRKRNPALGKAAKRLPQMLNVAAEGRT